MALTRIPNGLLNTNLVTTSKISTENIVTDDIANNTITGNLITDNTLTYQKILSSSSPFQQLGYNTSGVGSYLTNKSICINRIISNYTGSPYVTTASYAWVPGLFYDYTPLRADSLIKWSANFSIYWADGNSYGIMHQYFYWNDQARDTWTYGAQYHERRVHYERVYPSWGITSGRIGIQSRYYNSSYYGGFHGTTYWDGAGGQSGNSRAQLVIEEFLNN